MAQTTFSGPVLEGKEGVNIETKTSNYTVTTADSGKTFVSSTDGVVFTLPVGPGTKTLFFGTITMAFPPIASSTSWCIWMMLVTTTVRLNSFHSLIKGAVCMIRQWWGVTLAGKETSVMI
jgi:hypothetical protein